MKPLVQGASGAARAGRRRLLALLPAALLLGLPLQGLAQDAPFERGSRTRGLTGGWGVGYRPSWAPTRSDVAFVAFHPRMGWFVRDRLELYGEGTLFVYHAPAAAVSAGLGGLAGRYYLTTSGRWVTYVHGGAGLLWTSLDVIEIDRVFNFQHFIGIGWRQNRPRGPRLVLELRNHHISNAGTAGGNLGVNAATLLSGVEWVLRPDPARARAGVPGAGPRAFSGDGGGRPRTGSARPSPRR